MRILLDARTAATGLHGIARATAELGSALPAQLPAGWELYFLKLFEGESEKPSPHVVPCRARPYSWAEQWQVPGLLRPDFVDLYHLPTFWGPLRSPVPRVVTVHDLIHPLFYGRVRSRYLLLYRFGVGPLVRRARHVVTGSEASAQLIRAFFQLPRERVTVIPYGVDHVGRRPASVPESLGLEPRRFIYAMGNPRPHKNLAAAVEAYRRYRERCQQPEDLLVLGGGDELADSGRGVRVVRGLDDAELRWIRENALFGVFPSLMEGFDLPFLEALATGEATVASNIPPHREIAGADYPLVGTDPEALAQQMVKVREDEGLRRDLEARGPSLAEPYRWSETARRVVALWRQLLEGDSSD